MSGEQTALVRVPKKELALAEQIARAKKGQRTGNGILLGSGSLVLASLIGLLFAPHIAVGALAVGMLGSLGGAFKHDMNLLRVSEGEQRRRDQQQEIEKNRLLRLEAVATAVLETERLMGTLALGREIRLDFENEPQKILRIEEMGSVFGPDSEKRQIRLRIAASLYEAETGPHGGLRPSGNVVLMTVRHFEPMSQAQPPDLSGEAPDLPPSSPSRGAAYKKLPPCTAV
jgi:hypothetical protein